MTSFRHNAWLLSRAPASWVLLLAVGILAVLAPDDRADLAAMTEEVANTSRAIVLYGFSVLFAVAWALVAEAEQARHLAGASIRRQRRSQVAVHAAAVLAVLAAFAGVVLLRWALVDPSPGAGTGVVDGAWPVRELVYLGLTAVVVVSLTTAACAGRSPAVAILLGLALPLIHLAVYYGTDLPGHELLQGAWPTTAVGVIARGDASEGGIGVAVLAAVVVMATVGWAALRCDRPAVPARRPLRLRSWRSSTTGRGATGHRTVGTRSAALLVAGTVAVAGIAPTLLTHQPAGMRVSLWLERLDGTDPVAVAEDFTQAAQQGDVDRLDRLSATGESAPLIRAVPQTIIRSQISGVFTLVDSTDIERATVLGLIGGAAVHFSLRKLDGRWLVQRVVSG